MAKGSQLSQLKSALSQAGISQPSQGKKRKRSKNEDVDKERKAAKLREIQQKMNPFDVQVTKLKHDVGGRKIKGTSGRPAQSKQAGVEQRTKTLLKEYQSKDRSGGILDRRFGENDPTMTPEERMLERFTRERQRASKGAMFNLDDEDELTHYGQSLSKLDDFDNVGLGLDEDEDDDPGQIDPETVGNAHFGGFGDEGEGEEPERKKSKAEVMAEVIAKSKEHKFLRKAQQAEDEGLRNELDNELESLRAFLYGVGPEKPGPSNAAVPVLDAKLDIQNKEDQEFDKVVRELAFEQRARPKDRTKTEEELALEEMHALQTAERKRQRRMMGDDASDFEEETGRKKRQRHVGGDDLEDECYDESILGGLGSGLGDQSGELELAGSDSDVQDAGDFREDDTSDSSDDDGEAGPGESESQSEGMGSDADEDPQELVPSLTVKKKRKTTTRTRELPFTFLCPSSHEGFLDIIEGIDEVDVPTVVQRIRTLYHPSLAEENKSKLQRFSGVLVDHILHVTAPPSPRFGLLSGLLPHLFALTQSYPSESALHFIDKLALMQRNLKRGLSRGATNRQVKTWPGLSELSLLRIIGLLWSTSDLNHHVVSPSRLLMGSYLGLCRVRSLTDISSGLFICTLWLQFEELSKRFVPEAINFLLNTVLHIAPHGFTEASAIPGSFPSPDFLSYPELTINAKHSKELKIACPDFSSMHTVPADEQSKINLLGLALNLLERFADMYKGLDGFIELYQPVKDILIKVHTKKLPEALKNLLSNVDSVIGRLLKFAETSRLPLTLQQHKPIPIPSYVPKFDVHASSYLRNRDPDYERNEAVKLRRQHKDERKGAIRELRKDAKFLAGVKQKEQQEKDQGYNERIKKAVASIDPERAEEKALQREKAKEKRRSGKK